MADGANKLMTRVTTGLGFVAASARDAKELSLSFPLPYTHYSLIARSQALQRYFLDHGSWESAVPDLKDPDRIPAPSTLRRWCHRLDSSRPAFSFLRPALETMAQWLTRGERLECDCLRLSWRTLFPFLRVFWPLRL
jgi:hypothetical protein